MALSRLLAQCRPAYRPAWPLASKGPLVEPTYRARPSCWPYILFTWRFSVPQLIVRETQSICFVWRVSLSAIASTSTTQDGGTRDQSGPTLGCIGPSGFGLSRPGAYDDLVAAFNRWCAGDVLVVDAQSSREVERKHALPLRQRSTTTIVTHLCACVPAKAGLDSLHCTRAQPTALSPVTSLR